MNSKHWNRHIFLKIDKNPYRLFLMASCLVPDFPAVMVALEHIKELDKQLKEDRMAFSPAASVHLTQISAAVAELEAEQRAVHERLEVETIENSNLRQQISDLRERIGQEIMADVASARAANAEEMEQLHQDLTAVSQLLEATLEKQEILLSQNKELCPEREQVRARHDKVVAALNDQITLKYGLQKHLEQSLEQIEELKSCIAAVEQDKMGLQQSVALQRKACTVKQENLSREVGEVEGKMKKQKQAVKRCQRELDRVHDKKQETGDHLAELTFQAAKLESSSQRLSASRCQSEGQLEMEKQKQQELRQQRETLKKERCQLREAFRDAIQHLKEEIATVEGKMEKVRSSGRLYCESLAQIAEKFNSQQDEENKVRVEHLHVSQQLERSKQQLEERIASLVKHRKEIKEMDKQVAELLEAEMVSKRVFKRDREEVCRNMNTERRNTSHFEEERSRLRSLLEGAKREQEEHVAQMNSEIGFTRRRCQELQQVEAKLQQRQPKSVDVDLFMSHIQQCEVEYRQEEAQRHEEIERCAAQTKIITRSNKEKLSELEEKEERLKEVEALWSSEQVRHEKVKMQMSEVRRKRSHLELSIQGLQEETSSLLQAKEELKAMLEEMRKNFMVLLEKQASELKATEMVIYDNSVKLEQVRMENSRLHLRITQMSDGVSRAREDRERYMKEVDQYRQSTEHLLESLQEAWKEDVLVTQDSQSTSGDLLVVMGATKNSLKNRGEQLESVSTLLHQQTLDFSRRLGGKIPLVQQSVSADL